MPETYSMPEPEVTAPEKAQRAANAVLAGQGVPRTVGLYLLAAALVLTPAAPLAILPLLLLLASDTRLS